MTTARQRRLLCACLALIAYSQMRKFPQLDTCPERYPCRYPIDTPAMSRSCQCEAGCYPIDTPSTHRKGPRWGRALRVRKTTHMVTMPMLCSRRKFVGHVTNSHGATARALGHAGSLQRVRRALFNFARRHSEGALTRAILAEGSLGTLRICTAPQRERLGTQDPCRGFGGHFSNSHGVTARAL